jgi:hypothetical protein
MVGSDRPIVAIRQISNRDTAIRNVRIALKNMHLEISNRDKKALFVGGLACEKMRPKARASIPRSADFNMQGAAL